MLDLCPAVCSIEPEAPLRGVSQLVAAADSLASEHPSSPMDEIAHQLSDGFWARWWQPVRESWDIAPGGTSPTYVTGPHRGPARTRRRRLRRLGDGDRPSTSWNSPGPMTYSARRQFHRGAFATIGWSFGGTIVVWYRCFRDLGSGGESRPTANVFSRPSSRNRPMPLRPRACRQLHGGADLRAGRGSSPTTAGRPAS